MRAMDNMGARAWAVAAVAVTALSTATALGAQVDDLEDGRWLPYLGCWVQAGAAADGPMTCVVPEAGGVAFLTVSTGAVTERRLIQGDGVERAVEVAGCAGVESARFSTDGERLFTRSTMNCGVDTERENRGIIAVVGPDQWVEIRALAVAEGGVAWTRRYRPASTARIEAAGFADRVPAGRADQLAEAARVAASSSLTVEEVIEAHNRTATEAVRAWIVEQGDPLPLDADRLIQLADAGVSEEVIDVAVAMSFPDRFAVGRQETDSGQRGYDRTFGVWPVYSPFGFHDPLYDRYRYGYGYDRYGWGGYYPGYGPTTIIVTPTTRSAPAGRLVRGRGYKPGGSGSTIGTATRRTNSSIGSRPASSSRGAVTSRGSSSGSKGKAKRRGGN